MGNNEDHGDDDNDNDNDNDIQPQLPIRHLHLLAIQSHGHCILLHLGHDAFHPAPLHSFPLLPALATLRLLGDSTDISHAEAMGGECAASPSNCGVEGELEKSFASQARALAGAGEVKEGEAGALQDQGGVGGGEEVCFRKLGLEFVVQEGELGGGEGGDVDGLHGRAYKSDDRAQSRMCASMKVCVTEKGPRPEDFLKVQRSTKSA